MGLAGSGVASDPKVSSVPSFRRLGSGSSSPEERCRVYSVAGEGSGSLVPYVQPCRVVQLSAAMAVPATEVSPSAL